MANTSYTPAYYTSLHDSIASLCKTILPFSLKKRRLPPAQAAEQRQSENLKWQQDSFHQIVKLIGLCREGIVPESEVSAFRTHLLDTLVASPVDLELPVVLRDKLVFLQELLYAKCISEEDYHSSKRPLLHRLAVQGAEIDSKDVTVSALEETLEEEWSEIDLKDEPTLLSKEKNSSSKQKSRQTSAIKQIKGAASVLGFVSSHTNGRGKEEDKGVMDRGSAHQGSIHPKNASKRENSFWESYHKEKKPFRTLFQREKHEIGDHGPNSEKKSSRFAKKSWGLDGFKKWKRSDVEDDETAEEATLYSRRLVSSPVGEGPDTKQIKRKLHSDGSSSDFFIDKVLGEKIKKELLGIQAERHPDLHLSDDQIEAISTRLPVDKADLKNFFPKSWCDKYGDVVVGVVRKEFKDHVAEMERLRNVAREKQSSSRRWGALDDGENRNPNLFAPRTNSIGAKHSKYNPFAG
ncbi:hypothetical protein NMG60_11005140 [Bertholletia excelsa]